MSHFTVLVVGDDPETELAPYYEEIGINPKWDWHQLGGRWSGYFLLRKGRKGDFGGQGAFNNKRKTNRYDQARKKNIDLRSLFPTFAVLKNGTWYEQGKMGWWGFVDYKQGWWSKLLRKDPKTIWEAQFKKLVSDIGDDELISIYDCHI